MSTTGHNRGLMRYAQPDGNYRRVTSTDTAYKTSKYSHAELDNSIDAFDFPQNSPLIQGQSAEWRPDPWSDVRRIFKCFTLHYAAILRVYIFTLFVSSALLIIPGNESASDV